MTSFRDTVQNLFSRIKDPTPTGEFWALRDINFDIEAGQVVGIIGHNGAGKSTLLKILSRITEPTSGEIIIGGRMASLLEVGTGFHPELSGRENVFLNGAILGMTKVEIARKFDEIVAFAEVERFIDTPVKRYSSGMYVRLAFAVAAHLEPDILIIDEVLSVGDQAFQQKCLGKMQDVSAQQGRTVLFVSHHMAAIRRLCQKCIVLSRGQASPMLGVDEAVERYNANFRLGESGHRIDVSGLRRDRDLGRDVKMVQIEAVGEPPLVYGGRLIIELTLEASRAASDVMVGLGFDTMEGARIMSLDTDAGGRLMQLTPGRHRVRVELPMLPLHPGQYVVSAVVGSGGHYMDGVGRFAVWEVLTSLADRVSDRGFGGCRIIPEMTYEAAV